MPPLLFLSHAGADTEAAHALTRAIESAPDAQAASLKVWLDKRDLVPGREWQRQLEDAIGQQATAFAVLVDTRGTVNWVEREVRLALSRATSDSRFPFIPLLVGEAKSRDLPPFAQQYHAARGTAATDPDLLRGLLRAVLQPEARDFRPALESHPFVGLRAFEEGETRLFFGRERETKELVQRLADTPLIMVVGDSGSGKSSLVKAGLVPAFRGGALADLAGDQPDPRRWHIVSLRPRGAPFAGLTEAVADAARRAGLGLADIDHLRERIRRRDAQSIRDALTDAAPAPKLVLLVIDQFEELWTQTADAERRAFVEVVAELRASAGQDLRLVLTMRRDYYYQVSEFPEFFAQLEAADGKAKFVTRRMANEAMRDAILKPLSLTDAWNEAAAQNLAERVLRDAGDRPGDLALVQMALAEAWRARGEGQDLLAAYLSRGGVAGALAQAAQEVLDRKLAGEPEPRVRGVFLRLARLGEAGGATRRIARRDEFDAEGWDIVQRLAGTELAEGNAGVSTRPLARLVAIAGEPGEETAEILHEALFTQWASYARWLREWGAGKRILDRLADDVAEWRKGGEAVRPLAIGADLEVFRALRDGAETGIWLSPDERRFVDESEQAQKAASERAAAQAADVLRLTNARADAEFARAQDAARSAARARRLTAGAALLAILAMVFAGFAWHFQGKSEAAAGLARAAVDEAVKERKTAEDARGRAEERRRAADAAAQRAIENESLALAALSDVARREGRAADALRLALASWPRRTDDPRPALSSALRVMGSATGDALEVISSMRHEKSVSSVAFSPDGTRVVTASQDGTAQIWNAASGAAMLPPLRHGGPVRSATISRDGSRVLTAADNSAAWLWDAANGARIGPLPQNEPDVYFAAFSPNGQRVVTASLDGTARLWDAASGASVGIQMDHADNVRAAAFSPDGQRLVTISAGTAQLWEAESGTRIGAPMKHKARVVSVAFSPDDGRRVATASEDGTAQLWDGTSGEPIGASLKHECIVRSVAFSPRDGRHVVTASNDRTAQLWDGTSGEPIGMPLRHDGPVVSASFSPVDGRRVVTASDDGTARLWDVASGAPIGAPLRHDGPVVAASFSPDDGRLVATASGRTARLWVSPPLIVGQPLGAHDTRVSPDTFNRDGTRLLVTSDHHVELRDARNGALVGDRLRHHGVVRSAEFSPNGQYFLVAAAQSVQVWDSAGGTAIGSPLDLQTPLQYASWSPDGARIVTLAGSAAQIWDYRTSLPIGPSMQHDGFPLHAVINRNITRILTTTDDSAILWDLTTNMPIRTRLRHSGAYVNATFNRDGDLFLIEGNNGLAVYDSQDGALRYRNHEHGEDHMHAEFSPDGKWVVTVSSGGTVQLLEAAGGAPIGPPILHKEDNEGGFAFALSPDGTRFVTAPLYGTTRLSNLTGGNRSPAPLRHGDEVVSASFSRDGTRIVTASRDGIARLWDAVSGAPIGPTLGHGSEVKSAAFSRDGTRLLTNGGGETRLWDVTLPMSPIPSIACALLLQTPAGRGAVDLAALNERYGLTLGDPICEAPGPPFDPARIDPR